MTLRSPLHEVHEELGASLTAFAGWSMPVRYTSELEEHHAVRTRAGLFDLSHMAEIELRGAGAAAALDHALVGELSAVEPGRARYTMLCSADGGVLDDVVVYRRAPDEFLVVANAANRDLALTELVARAEGFDVDVRDRTDAFALVAVQGPVAARVLQQISAAPLADLRYYAAMDAVVAGIEVLLARTGYTGEDGFELYCRAGEGPALWRALAEAGAPYGLAPCGLAARDTLRLEAGMPLYGQELGAGRTPAEAGLGRVVASGKSGDFVGRAALAGAAEPPAEHLVGLVAEGRRAPRAGYAVLDDAGEEIGRVTSGALSPTLGVPIAMAYVPSSIEVGATLAVDVRGTPLGVTVVALPFYRRQP